MKKLIIISVCVSFISIFQSWSQCVSLENGPVMEFQPITNTVTKQLFLDSAACNGNMTFSNVPSGLNLSYSTTTKKIAGTWGLNTGSNRSAQVQCSIPSQGIEFTLYVTQGTVMPQGSCSLDDFLFESQLGYIPIVSEGETLEITPTFSGSSNCYGLFEFHEVPSWTNFQFYYATSNPFISITSQENLNPEAREAYVVLSVPTKNIYKAILIRQSHCNFSWYRDTDGDGFGDSNAIPVDCDQYFTGAVRNNLDFCPNTYSLVNNGCETGYVHPDINWVRTESNNILGATISKSIVYFDGLGKGIQNQTIDLKTGKTWATQTLYDAQGRTAVSTLSAPLNDSGSFGYVSDFIQDSGNGQYSLSDFETNIENPATVGTQQNTLGWYYSDANTDEPYQDKTDRPYSRTIYSNLNPGAAKQTIGGNKIEGAWKQGYSFSMPAAQEMYYVFGYDYFETSPDIENTYEGIETTINDSNKQIVWLKTTKSVVEDVHGNEAVVFTDTDGKTLGAARAGIPENPTDEKQYEVLSLIGEQKYVDIHIPKGCGNTSSFIGTTSNYKVYDLKTEEPFTSTPSTLSAGFYRVEYIGSNVLTKNHTLSYIDKASGNIAPVVTNAVGIRYNVNYYDFSLNYYNAVGNLTASLQPIGFNNSCFDNLAPTTNHLENLKTTFSYNALGQLVTTTSPDEGTASFKYREDGQIRFSQNSKQTTSIGYEYSYTNYDEFGRPTESGVAYRASGTSIWEFTQFFQTNSNENDFTASRKEQHFTEYDFLSDASELSSLITHTDYHNPSFLAGNVAKTWNTDENGNLISASYYSYDLYGRVQWIVQNINGLGFKTIDYEYDPVTSQVLKVIYQKQNANEVFAHRYTYNSTTNELEKVETSTNNNNFTTHADYSYYETGALKRVELAEGIQGIDYVYNLAGQLKAINHPNLNSSANNPNNDANDLFGMTLDYYNGDYQRSTDFSLLTSGTNQYNGNIKGMTWNTNTDNVVTNPFQYSYQYNKSNWLTEANFNANGNVEPNNTPENLELNTVLTAPMDAKATHSITLLPGFEATNNFTATIVAPGPDNDPFSSGDYKVHGITYDANGNIQTLNRNKNTENSSNAMDELTYEYWSNKPNQLKRVDDAVTSVTNANDIKDQVTENNYIYNVIGQLIENKDENVKYEYNASGLVTKVFYNNNLKVQFYYNDKGFRTKKVSYQDNSGTLDKTTYYVLDAAGSTMAIYENNQQVEMPIYGASRLGVYKKPSNTSVYQLTDHLGNVRAVIAKDGNGNAAALVSATDYYPFGMPMPNRQIVNGEPYRYAFQGQEKDPETGKEAFQLRLWDSRIGRWLTTDPAGQFNSPYLGMGNNPVSRIDPDGGYSPPTDYVNTNTGERTHVEDGIDQTLFINNNDLFNQIKNFAPENERFFSVYSEQYKGLLFRAIGNDALQFNELASSRFIDNFAIYGEDLFYSQIDKLTPNYEGYPGPVQTAANNLDVVDFGLKLVVWRQGTLRGDSGITNNAFEHQIGSFLTGQRHGSLFGGGIPQYNEVQNIIFADRRNGNIWRALLGMGGTAFEWKDVYNNAVGQALSFHYSFTR
ncbi:RHS repeat-associated core domain-containing protein [Polaribacter sp.]|nr:RHS repeat-associated core domain-containing protein [Polaribacter sp.]